MQSVHEIGPFFARTFLASYSVAHKKPFNQVVIASTPWGVRRHLGVKKQKHVDRSREETRGERERETGDSLSIFISNILGPIKRILETIDSRVEIRAR